MRYVLIKQKDGKNRMFKQDIVCSRACLQIITDRPDQPVLLESTSDPSANMDKAFSREVNRQGQRNPSLVKYIMHAG